MSESKSKYWLDLVAAEIVERFPTGEVVVSSGISPSASYHIGHFREIMTADAIAWRLRQDGRSVRHVHVVDNFDPLRKRYHFLPERFEQFVGQPVCLIPDPVGDCHLTYAEHFFQEFQGHFESMGIGGAGFEVVKSYEDLYSTGRMAKWIDLALERTDKVREIFQSTSNRPLPKDWTPVQLLDENNIFHNGELGQWDQTTKTLGGIDYSKGRAKLNWRLDWPARWGELGVIVEPFSAQEHGAAGGSYDTGVRFAKEVFNISPPFPGAKYANIHLLGETTKMSSSKGNLVTPAEALEIMPAEILRYFVVRSRPDRTLYFDPGMGLYRLIDEFAHTEQAVKSSLTTEFREAYNFAIGGANANHLPQTVSSIPFSHLVTVYQAALGDEAAAIRLLKNSD